MPTNQQLEATTVVACDCVVVEVLSVPAEESGCPDCNTPEYEAKEAES